MKSFLQSSSLLSRNFWQNTVNLSVRGATVCKFGDFSATQILREINFEKSNMYQKVILPILEP